MDLRQYKAIYVNCSSEKSRFGQLSKFDDVSQNNHGKEKGGRLKSNLVLVDHGVAMDISQYDGAGWEEGRMIFKEYLMRYSYYG